MIEYEQLEFLIENMIGIINEKKTEMNNKKNKPSENKEFFREFYILETKILSLIEKIGMEKGVSSRKLSLAMKKYKENVSSYQNQWEESYWMMYNSSRVETETEYCSNPDELVDMTTDTDDINLQNIDMYIDRISVEKESELSGGDKYKEKSRVCGGCLIF